METIQIALDAKLLQDTDRAAKIQRKNRASIIRDALRGHLKQLKSAELEARDRRGYIAKPQQVKEYRVWEDIAAWPED